MPEGDTIHKLARALGSELEGQRLDALWLRDRGYVGGLAGARVREVAALGKHLLVVLARQGAADWVLHVHLGMHGRWQRAPSGAPPRAAKLLLAARGSGYACTRPAVAELLRRVDVTAHPVLRRLGPDLLGPELPLPRILARARRSRAACVAELLLDQTVACGLGNVYKSEVLFLSSLHPFTPVDRLSDGALEQLYRRGRELLGWNLGGWRRTTLRRVEAGRDLPRGEPRLWVYGRAGLPCLRCGSRIAATRLGDGARATWWCEGCQPRLHAEFPPASHV